MASTSANDSKIIFSVLKYLKAKHSSEELSDEKKESLEVGIMCLQSVFDVDLDSVEHQSKYGSPVPLEALFNGKAEVNTAPSLANGGEVNGDQSNQQEAEGLKNQGNGQMKEGQYNEAINSYSKAISLDSSNATYYANRAAAYMKIDKYQEALDDCTEAVRLNPQYAKVYMRMGKIYQTMNNMDKAKECYSKAVELEPDNVEYKNLRAAFQPNAGPGGPTLGGGGMPGGMGGIDPSTIGNLMNNPAFMNLASNVMSNPMFQNVASNLLQSQAAQAQGGGGPLNLGEMMPQFAQMAQQMHDTNPEMFESLRNQSAHFRPHHNDTLPPDEGSKK